MSNFRDVDRQTGFLLPPSVDEWLPQRHLARFVVEVIDGLDLRALVGSYRGSGSASYHPSMLLGLLVYGYATGVFASRKLERATYDSVAFRFIAANDHPDHDTIATFRLRFLKAITELFYAQRKHIPEPVFGIIKSVAVAIHESDIQLLRTVDGRFVLPPFAITPLLRVGRPTHIRPKLRLPLRDGLEPPWHLLTHELSPFSGRHSKGVVESQ